MATSGKTSYTAEPQQRLDGVWQQCQPHQAARWAVIRTRWLPTKRGQARPAPKRKVLATFFGEHAEEAARDLVAHSLAISKKKPRNARNRGIYASSLTKEQWLAAQEQRRS